MPVENSKDLIKYKISFLYKAIEDAQQTNRLVDTKVSIVFILFGVYVSMIGSGMPKFAEYIWNMPCILKVFFGVVLLVSFLIVIVLAYTTLMIIFPRSNPSQHISMKNSPQNIFYLWQLNTNLIDCFVNRKSVILKPSFEDYLSKYAEIDDSVMIEKELIYELLKVSYIREMKITRVRYMKWWLMSALILSFVLIYLHFIGLSCYMD